MRLLGLDLETTGLDTGNDRVTELGVVLWDVEEKRPLVMQGCFLVDDGIRARCNEETLAMMKRVSGIKQEYLEEFGRDPKGTYEQLELFVTAHKSDFIVAHNGENFDKPMFIAELNRHQLDAPVLRSLPWLDTRADIPHTTPPDSLKLKHLAGDLGFINPFSHRAVFDVLTMLKVLSHYDINEVVAYSRIPFITVRACVTYERRQLAKDCRFSWENLGDKSYPKLWVKRIKEDKFEDERKVALDKGFEIVKLS